MNFLLMMLNAESMVWASWSSQETFYGYIEPAMENITVTMFKWKIMEMFRQLRGITEKKLEQCLESTTDNYKHNFERLLRMMRTYQRKTK
jgi:hypothetical protein